MVKNIILDTYDDFNFMVVLLFLYFVLVGFIIIIIINAKSKYKAQNPNLYPPSTTTTTQYKSIKPPIQQRPLATMASILF
jgi:hypothetical protein